ncbi:hypothetical protein GCM10027275_37770 [Rhabdobacter roseus]
MQEVVNLEEFNSEFDDYNSNLAQNRYGELNLVFSSKRNKKEYLNLVHYEASLRYDEKKKVVNGLLKGYLGGGINERYNATSWLASYANGDFNVYGPNVLSMKHDFPWVATEPEVLTLFYADDAAGRMQIKYLYYDQNKETKGPFTFDMLNSTGNDAYPTFSQQGDKIYFCSDRAGTFDLYEVTIQGTHGTRLESFVNPKNYSIRKMDELSSPYHDKCPYLYGNTLVFVSDRPGGQGGFDIYYSTLEDGRWSPPLNAGSRINTAANEYRPILPDLSNFNYNLMLFSSDRPGGKGGYDLYMTGLTERKYW